MSTSSILIIGKNGKTGARVQSRLERAGHEAIGVSRSTDPTFDWESPGTWSESLQGVRAAYVTYHPDLALPQAQGAITLLSHMAVEAGVEHLVMLSGRGEAGAQRAEAALQASGIDWNIVRASWFAQNFSENFFLDGVLAGQLMLPACTTREPFVDVDDIADVAVAALLEPGLRNRVFEVTGPRAMTFAECVAEIEVAVGYDIRLEQVPLEEYLGALAAVDVPADMLSLLRELFTVLFDGRNETVTDGVMQAIGRPATDFRDYVVKTARTGVWGRPVPESLIEEKARVA